MNNRPQRCLIHLESTQRDGEDVSSVKIDSDGQLLLTDSGCEITYDEIMDQSFGKTQVRITVSKRGSDTYVILQRGVGGSSKLILESGKRHMSNYVTPFGALNFYVTTSNIKYDFDGRHLTLDLTYTLELGNVAAGEFSIALTADIRDTAKTR